MKIKKTNKTECGKHQRQKSLNVLSCNKLINWKVKNHFCVLLSHTHTQINKWDPLATWRLLSLSSSHCAYDALYASSVSPLCSLFLRLNSTWLDLPSSHTQASQAASQLVSQSVTYYTPRAWIFQQQRININSSSTLYLCFYIFLCLSLSLSVRVGHMKSYLYLNCDYIFVCCASVESPGYK